MSRSRFATPLMLTLTAAGTFGLAASQAGIVDLPAGYGLIEDAPGKTQTPPAAPRDAAKTAQEHRCGARHAEHAEKMKDHAEGMCGADHAEHAEHAKVDHEGACGAQHAAPTEAVKTEQEGKCGEGKCGEGKCGGAI